MGSAKMKTHQPEILFSENKVTLKIQDSEKIVTFSYAIGAIEKFDNRFVVMIDPPANTIFNENIYGVSYDGKILWQVEKIAHVDQDSPYTGIGKENNFLSAYNWDGHDYCIDLNTGKILGKKFVK